MPYGDNGSILRATSELSPLGTAPGNVPQKYFYQTNDADTVVETNGYFDGVLNNGLKAGDIIEAYLDIDGTPELKFYRVTGTGADVGLTVLLSKDNVV